MVFDDLMFAGRTVSSVCASLWDVRESKISSGFRANQVESKRVKSCLVRGGQPKGRPTISGQRWAAFWWNGGWFLLVLPDIEGDLIQAEQASEQQLDKVALIQIVDQTELDEYHVSSWIECCQRCQMPLTCRTRMRKERLDQRAPSPTGKTGQ